MTEYHILNLGAGVQSTTLYLMRAFDYAIFADTGWPIKVPHPVPRSACVFCPYHSDAEWLDIQRTPEDWARALQIDEAIRTHSKLKSKVFLHRSLQPLVQIEFNPNPTARERQLSLSMAQECLGVCGV